MASRIQLQYPDGKKAIMSHEEALEAVDAGRFPRGTTYRRAPHDRPRPVTELVRDLRASNTRHTVSVVLWIVLALVVGVPLLGGAIFLLAAWNDPRVWSVLG